MGKVVGFVVTPGEIENRISAIDRAVLALDADITGYRGSKLSDAWREAWNGFRRRWAIERDSYVTWDSRLFATRVMPRLEAFESNYRKWAEQFQKKTRTAPTVPSARPSEGLISFGSDLWVLAAIGVVAWVYFRGK